VVRRSSRNVPSPLAASTRILPDVVIIFVITVLRRRSQYAAESSRVSSETLARLRVRVQDTTLPIRRGKILFSSLLQLTQVIQEALLPQTDRATRCQSKYQNVSQSVKSQSSFLGNCCTTVKLICTANPHHTAKSKKVHVTIHFIP